MLRNLVVAGVLASGCASPQEPTDFHTFSEVGASVPSWGASPLMSGPRTILRPRHGNWSYQHVLVPTDDPRSIEDLTAEFGEPSTEAITVENEFVELCGRQALLSVPSLGAPMLVQTGEDGFLLSRIEGLNNNRIPRRVIDALIGHIQCIDAHESIRTNPV
jgi:hypothetical protein